MSSGIERIPSSPLQGPGAPQRVGDREARRERGQAFDEALNKDGGAADEKPKKKPERRDPHPPPDEDSGNALDVIA